MTTRERRTPLTLKKAMEPLTPFTDEQGRECYLIKPKRGREAIALKEHIDAIRPYQITGVFSWNNDDERDEDGNLKRHYLKTTARKPGKRGRKNVPYGMTVSSLIVKAMMKRAGVRFPKGYEVAFVNLDQRHDLRPENLLVRPRGENKHWVSAVLAFTQGFVWPDKE